MAQPITIDRMLYSVADAPDIVLQQLRQQPDLASKQDAHGYSLVHAAASYGHVDLLRALVQELNVDINIKDEDGETALFNVESVEMADELVKLGINISEPNNDGQSADVKLDDEDEQPQVAAFLKQQLSQSGTGTASSSSVPIVQNGTTNGGEVSNPPPLPNGMNISIGTMSEVEEGEAPDPELRRRIEELAARQDFHDESGQRELRELVSQVVTGISHEERNVTQRRRID